MEARKEARKASKKLRRQRRRQGMLPTERVPCLYKKDRGIPLSIPTSLAPVDYFPVVQTGYTGDRVDDIREMQAWTLDELVARGFNVFEWDGRWACYIFFFALYWRLYGSRTPYVILDCEGRIIGVLAGRPVAADGMPDDWDDVVARVVEAIEQAHKEMHFTDGDLHHRRGPQATRAFGFSHGGGQRVCLAVRRPCSLLMYFIFKHPMNRAQDRRNRPILQRLQDSPDMQRIAGFGSSASGCFASYLLLTRNPFSRCVFVLCPQAISRLRGQARPPLRP